MNRYLIPVMSLLLLLPVSGHCSGLDGLADLLSSALESDAPEQSEQNMPLQFEGYTALGAPSSVALRKENNRVANVDTGQFMLVRVSSGVYALYSLDSEDRKDPGVWLGSVKGRIGMGVSYRF
ncbi:hypothetical protein [Amphritea japonica]|uniref:hypothetical protein n=1 Tax=Amphritea japonica TaxID=452627 RepID=UPI00036DCFFA|nr:hypothetical protein [Amphritea japonica]